MVTAQELSSDAVFAFKPSLTCDFIRHDRAEEAPDPDVSGPYYTAQYDFVLTRAAAASAA